MSKKNCSNLSIESFKSDDQFPLARISTQIQTTSTFYLKTSKPGKLYTGTVSNAFNKTKLGSIPTKKENVIISTKINLPPRNAPSPEYNNSKKYVDIEPRTEPKPKGRGFLSSTDRFDSYNLFQQRYLPGPCEYSNINDRRPKKFFNSANLSQTVSLSKKYTTPGPGEYDYDYKPIFDSITKSSFFVSKTKRGDQANSKMPTDPGKYFNDILSNEFKMIYNKPQTKSPFFIKPIEKKRDLVTDLGVNSGDKKRLGFKLKDKKGKVATLESLSTVAHLSEKPECYSDKKNRKFEQLLTTSESLNERPRPFILKKIEKEPLFALSSPRWKTEEQRQLEFKVPGPAYYYPRTGQTAPLSFNFKFIKEENKVTL